MSPMCHKIRVHRLLAVMKDVGHAMTNTSYEGGDYDHDHDSGDNDLDDEGGDPDHDDDNGDNDHIDNDHDHDDAKILL